MSIMVLISVRPIRKRAYEFFYLSHVLLVMYVTSRFISLYIIE